MNRVKLSQSDFLLFLVAILLLIVYLVYYAEIFPDASLRFTYDESQIVKKAYEIIRNLDYDISSMKHRSRIETDEDQLRYFQKTFGLKRSNELIMEDKIPVFSWNISLREGKQEDNLVSISFDGDDQAKEKIAKSPSDTITIRMSTSGELIGLNVRLGKRAKIDSLTMDEALAKATDFLRVHRPVTFPKYSLVTRDADRTGARLDYHFSWESSELIYDEKESVSVSVLGSQIGKFAIKHTPKEIVKHTGFRMELVIIPNIISFIGIGILVIVVLIRKLRRDEIELRSNIVLSVIVMLMWILMLAMSINVDEGRWMLTMLIPMLITAPFIFIAFFSVSAIAESDAREVWHEKIFTFEAARNGKILFPQFALVILRGLSMAFIAAGLLVLLLKAANSQFNFFFEFDDERFDNIISLLPVLTILGMSILTSSFGEMVFRLYIITTLRKKIGNIIVLSLISALFWVLAFNGYFNLKLSSYFLNFGINFIIGLVFVVFFLKTDFMTVWWGASVYILLRALYPMTFMDDGFIAWNGYMLWVIIGSSIIVALIGFSRTGDMVKIEKYVPDYIQRQAERQRVQRELEIARRVQLSFLPRSKPKLQGIDVASICIPATEVGGDYFDFFEIDDHRLGVVIGDVSGKGISAAFHMTLTKGFLKSQAKTGLSPREIIINMNELFYENVERGTFISMIYGIFDLRQRNFAFSRAGHNPLLIQKHGAEQVELLSPRGLALGLESGEIFDRVIEEYKIGIQTNDLFLFYTDGFSEAMNADKEEFGENRLQHVLESNPDHTAEQVIEAFKREIFKFVGQAPQHDDMTMLVVKIL